MKIVTVEEMRELEERAAEIGLPSEVLMENAGLAAAQEISTWLGGVEGCSILMLVGPGNNGGDGLVSARHFHDWGAKVHLYCPKVRADSDHNYQLTRVRGIPCTVASRDRGFNGLKDLLSTTDVVIDSLFGTGKSRPLEGPFKETLEHLREVRANRPSLKVVAIDLPSGLNPDTGATDSSCVAADLTVTLSNPKWGLFSFPGATKIGKLVISDIGIPSVLSDDICAELLIPMIVERMLPHRPLNANKGTFGKVLVVAGSINYIGAAYMACAAATRVGAGLVTLATACSLLPILASKLTEVTYLPLPESGQGVIESDASTIICESLSNYNVLLLGCGLGLNETTQEFVKAIIPCLSEGMPVVLDADALNILATVPEWWNRLPGDVVLTPHPGEMARLSGIPIDEIQNDRVGTAQEMAGKWNKTVVLKGAHTVVASPEGNIRMSGSANPGLASAGTGDILAGVIASLIAQGLSPSGAAATGVYLHSEAGELLRHQIGDAGMVASDILPVLPLVIKRIKEGDYATSH